MLLRINGRLTVGHAETTRLLRSTQGDHHLEIERDASCPSLQQSERVPRAERAQPQPQASAQAQSEPVPRAERAQPQPQASAQAKAEVPQTNKQKAKAESQRRHRRRSAASKQRNVTAPMENERAALGRKPPPQEEPTAAVKPATSQPEQPTMPRKARKAGTARRWLSGAKRRRAAAARSLPAAAAREAVEKKAVAVQLTNGAPAAPTAAAVAAAAMAAAAALAVRRKARAEHKRQRQPSDASRRLKNERGQKRKNRKRSDKRKQTREALRADASAQVQVEIQKDNTLMVTVLELPASPLRLVAHLSTRKIRTVAWEEHSKPRHVLDEYMLGEGEAAARKHVLAAADPGAQLPWSFWQARH